MASGRPAAVGEGGALVGPLGLVGGHPAVRRCGAPVLLQHKVTSVGWKIGKSKGRKVPVHDAVVRKYRKVPLFFCLLG